MKDVINTPSLTFRNVENKNTLGWINKKLDTEEEMITIPEDTVESCSKMKHQRKTNKEYAICGAILSS